MPCIFYNQIALPTNLNVQMDNASQLVCNVMGILTVLIEMIAVSVQSFIRFHALINAPMPMLPNLCSECFQLIRVVNIILNTRVPRNG